MMNKVLVLLVILLTPLANAVNAELPAYDIVMVERGGGDWRAIRYKPDTGESWYIRGGKFIKLHDTSFIPRSEYKVVMSKHKSGWGAVRLDMISGDTWKLKKETWLKVQEVK